MLLILAGAGCAAEVPDDACASAALAPLFNASADPGDLPLAAGQLAAIAPLTPGWHGGGTVCTATVIDRGLAITAAHCREFGALRLALAGIRGGIATFGPTPHPALDVMLLGFDGARAAAITPIPLQREAIGADWTGTQITLAGAGQTETGSSGELRFVREQIVDVTEDEIWVDGMGESGACGGDSGGPVLSEDAAGTVSVAGTLARGSADCLGLDVYVRADRIAGWVEQTAPGVVAQVQSDCR
jgi:hypothetical protein